MAAWQDALRQPQHFDDVDFVVISAMVTPTISSGASCTSPRAFTRQQFDASLMMPSISIAAGNRRRYARDDRAYRRALIDRRRHTSVSRRASPVSTRR